MADTSFLKIVYTHVNRWRRLFTVTLKRSETCADADRSSHVSTVAVISSPDGVCAHIWKIEV